MQIPLSSSSVSPAGTSRKRKRKPATQVKETPKETEEEEREVHHSPQREFSPPLAPELEEVPSSTKTTSKKGRKLHFPSLSPTDKTRFKRPFTRSSSHKEYVEAEVIPKASIPNKFKGKGEATEKPVEIININTPTDNPTFKRLIRQLRDARK